MLYRHLPLTKQIPQKFNFRLSVMVNVSPALSFRILLNDNRNVHNCIGLLRGGAETCHNPLRRESNKCPQRCLTAESTRPAVNKFVLSTGQFTKYILWFTYPICVSLLIFCSSPLLSIRPLDRNKRLLTGLERFQVYPT